MQPVARVLQHLGDGLSTVAAVTGVPADGIHRSRGAAAVATRSAVPDGPVVAALTARAALAGAQRRGRVTAVTADPAVAAVGSHSADTTGDHRLLPGSTGPAGSTHTTGAARPAAAPHPAARTAITTKATRAAA